MSVKEEMMNLNPHSSNIIDKLNFEQVVDEIRFEQLINIESIKRSPLDNNSGDSKEKGLGDVRTN